MTWEQLVFDAIKELCISKKSPYFRIKEIYAYEENFRKHYPNNNFIPDKIRQQLHYLDKSSKITLIDRAGNYKLNNFFHYFDNK